MRRLHGFLRVLVFGGATLGASLPGRADEPSVPLRLQAELSTKVIEYLQVPPIRSLDRVRIGIIVKPGSPESASAGIELKVAFDLAVTAAGHLHEQSIVSWSGAKELVEEAGRRELTVLYFTPGLDTEVTAAARALEGHRIMTIATVDSLVRRGAILGFEVVSGHPKMVFNLVQAKKQGVVLRSAVMTLMRIVE